MVSGIKLINSKIIKCVGKKKFNYGQVSTELSYEGLAVAANGFGLYARWRFKALTFKLALMMIEAQIFNLLLHRHWRKTRVTRSF